MNKSYSLDSNIVPPRGNVKERRLIQVLFYLFVINLVIPLLDLPFFGFSLSAFLFCLIFILSIRKKNLRLKKYRFWFLGALSIVFGILLSFFINGLTSYGTKVEGVSITVHYVYWLFLFVVSIYLLSEGVISIKRVVEMIALAVFFLALMRLFEMVAFGKFGAWKSTSFFTQNTYGFLFSMFVPTNYYLMIEQKGWKKLFSIIRVLALLVAILVNGSRSSWIALGVTLGVFFILAVISARSFKPILGFILTFVIVGMGFWAFIQFMPNNVVTAFTDRFNTFQTLETDKSYGIRKLEVQKGLKLFVSSPRIGIGTGRFIAESVELDIPKYMSYGSQEHFNEKSAHNSYIAFLAEEGLVGSIPFAILILLIATTGGIGCIRLARRGEFWALGVYLCFISMSVHMWSINSLTNTANWFVYALNVAMIVESKKFNKAKNGVKTRISLSYPGII